MNYSYDVAQICLTGHVITHQAETYPEETVKYCTKCGEKTITTCPKCSTLIRGFFDGDPLEYTLLKYYKRPSYCHECGNPYPWTERAISKSAEAIDDDEMLTENEKDRLKQSVVELIKDQQSPSRFKTFLKNAGRNTYEALRDILINVLSEAVAKSIWS